MEREPLAEQEYKKEVIQEFKGSLSRGEVEITLEKFMDMLNENEDLRRKNEALITEYDKNPWRKWEHLAHTLDSWRIIPRALMVFYMYLTFWSVKWFTNPANFGPEGPTSEQTTLISVLVGAGAAWFGAYVATGGRNKE